MCIFSLHIWWPLRESKPWLWIGWNANKPQASPQNNILPIQTPNPSLPSHLCIVLCIGMFCPAPSIAGHGKAANICVSPLEEEPGLKAVRVEVSGLLSSGSSSPAFISEVLSSWRNPGFTISWSCLLLPSLAHEIVLSVIPFFSPCLCIHQFFGCLEQGLHIYRRCWINRII